MSTNFVPLFDKMGTKPGNNFVNASRTGGGGGFGGRGFWGGQVEHVKLVGNATDEDFQTGRTKAPVLTTELPQSVNILIDSRNRLQPDINLNPFDFRVSLNANLFRSRYMRVRKVVIPKPPNINQNNNIFIFYEGADIQRTVVIPPGYYNTTQFANTLQALCTAASTNVFTCVFDAQTRTFNLSSIAVFFISVNCNFIQRGSSFVPFETRNELSGATVAGDGALSWNSGVASMLYTRYIYLCSEALNIFSFAVSRTSDTGINEDILAIVDITSIYSAEDWDVGRPFAGGYQTVETPESPHISLMNPQRNLNPQVDAYVLDEYGLDLNLSFDLSVVGGVNYPPNQAGISFWMEITF